MIWLYDSQGLVGSYKRFEDVCDYFRRLEHFNAMDCSAFYPDAFSEEKWDFSYYSYKRLCAVLSGLKRNARLTEEEQEAYENELDLIEVCSGDPQTLQQIVLFPDVDVTELARDWCFDYACSKNFVLLELIEGSLGSGNEKTLGHKCFPHGMPTDVGPTVSLSPEYDQGACPLEETQS